MLAALSAASGALALAALALLLYGASPVGPCEPPGSCSDELSQGRALVAAGLAGAASTALVVAAPLLHDRWSDRLRFVPPPGWPHPPSGWEPGRSWLPDASWPSPPPRWRFWR